MSCNQSFRYTHDIDDLLDGLERLGIKVPELIWEAADLTRFAWEARYPGVNESVAEDEYREAVELANRIVEWASLLVKER